MKKLTFTVTPTDKPYIPSVYFKLTGEGDGYYKTVYISEVRSKAEFDAEVDKHKSMMQAEADAAPKKEKK